MTGQGPKEMAHRPGGSRRARLRPALAALGLAAAVAHGGPAVAQTCTIGHVTPDYGSVDVLAGAAAETTGSFSISCSGAANQTVRLCLELSRGQTTTEGYRRLAAGSERLIHELYADSARTQIWGSWGRATTIYDLYPYGITVDLPLGSTGSVNTSRTIYGRIAAGQTTSGPGSYVYTQSTAPAAAYDYVTSTPCPTGSRQATSSGSSWTATVNAKCLVSASNLNFGSVGVLSSAVTATSTVSVRCTNGTPYTLALGAGNGSGATVAARRMTSGARTVTYSLFRDSGYSQVWGETSGTNTASGTGSGLTEALTVYGRVPAQTTPAPGTYSDTIVVTLTY